MTLTPIFGHSMFAPHPDDYIRLPAHTPPQVLVFVDTEEDFDWSKPKSRRNVSVTSARKLPLAQALFAEYGIKPCYLVDYPIVTTPESIETLRAFSDAGACDIGAQLHPWVNPPFSEEISQTNSFPGNLPLAVERAKLTSLTEAIRASFGLSPTVYRAGRYGIGPNTARLLVELGYRIDVSVRATFNYRDEGGPDFRLVKPEPYWATPDHSLMEIPLTTGFTGLMQRLGPQIYPWAGRIPVASGVLSRLNLLNRAPLTPEGVPLAEAKKTARTLHADGHKIFCIAFHSPSLEPGNTPYVRNSADLEALLGWLRAMLDLLLGELGAIPARADDVWRLARAATGPTLVPPPLSCLTMTP